MSDDVRPSILVVEDDPDIGRLLRLELTEAGFDVEVRVLGRDGLVAVREDPPDLVVLDLGLPDMDGAEVARRIRRTEALPIVVLTAADAIERKVDVFADGVDDYVVKPFHVAELVARIRARLRPVPEAATIVLGALAIDRVARQVTLEGVPVALRPREFDLLTHLALRPGRVFSRSDIERAVWASDEGPTSNVVDVHVAQLRNKLRAAGGYGWIRTVRGIGYALTQRP